MKNPIPTGDNSVTDFLNEILGREGVQSVSLIVVSTPETVENGVSTQTFERKLSNKIP